MDTEKMKFVNKSLRFQIQNPHNWTNITIVAENMCSSVALPVDFNSTCTQVNDSIVTSDSIVMSGFCSGMSHTNHGCYYGYQSDW